MRGMGIWWYLRDSSLDHRLGGSLWMFHIVLRIVFVVSLNVVVEEEELLQIFQVRV